MRAALAVRDMGVVYRALRDTGISQRQIAQHTGQSQSEVSEIIKGRVVKDYAVLERIAEGLGIPREYMGLSHSATSVDGGYRGVVTVAESEEAEDMLRRHLLALGGVALTGAAVTKLGALLAELPGPSPVPLPSRLSQAHVTQVRDLTRRLGRGDAVDADPEVCYAAAMWATRLLEVPGADPVRRALLVAVAELHSEAGWSAWEAGLYRRALYHFAHTLEQAIEADDAYLQALALRHAGLANVEHGHPDDGLKMLQCAQATAWDIPPDDERAVVVGVSGRAAVEAVALQESATALACLGKLDGAVTALAKGRGIWTPTGTDPFGDMDRPAARLELARGRLDVAESLAAASMRRWPGRKQVSRTMTAIVQATIHITAGEPRGLQLAHTAITDTAKLSSVRIRRQLQPLADTLDTRRSSDARDLARMARQVATVRV